MVMIEKQSEIGRDPQLAMLLRHKWQAEIEKAVDKVKLGAVSVRKRTEIDQWFRRQWYRAMIRDRKRLGEHAVTEPHSVEAVLGLLVQIEYSSTCPLHVRHKLVGRS